MTRSTVEITKHSGLIDWLTPKGVITGPSFIFRTIIAIVITIGPVYILSSLTVRVDPQGQSEALNTLPILFGGGSFLLGIWIILATITKHYRTKGMYAPFLFALITPFMPFMLILTWMFSSKERRIQNEHLAKQQDAMRKILREKRPAKMIDDKAEPRYVGRSKMANPAQKAELSYRNKEVPTVRRRR